MDKRKATRWRRNRRPDLVIVTVGDCMAHEPVEIDWRHQGHYRVRVHPGAVLYARRYV